MKKLLCLLLTMTMMLALGAPAFADDAAKAPVFKDGAAQPILQYTNLRDENYVNENSDILRFCVYVETDHDTDGDGKADLVEALVQVPPRAPNQQNPNQIFPMGDGFGFCIFFRATPHNPPLGNSFFQRHALPTRLQAARPEEEIKMIWRS